MNFLKIIEAIIGVGEEIVPIFIHNPKSRKIEGVIVSTLNGVLGGLGSNSGSTPGVTPTV